MDLQWLKSDEAKYISEDAKAKAWNDFKREYPFADLSKFEAQTDFNEKHATAEIYLSNDPDKKESNNGFEHVGMQKGANFTTVFTILLIGLNSKSQENFIKQYIYSSLLFQPTSI